jgi:MFS family permease
VLNRIKDRNIWIIYAATFLLGVAYGVSVALIALHLDARGFGKQQIGSLAAWFAAGIGALAVPGGALIRRFSAKTTLTVALAGYAVSVAVFPSLTSYSAIAAARFFDGAFSVCIWVGFETVLLQRAPKADKAYVTSLYAMAIAIGYILGPLAAKGIVAFAPMRVAFLVSGAIASAASLLVLLRLDRDGGDAEEGAGGAGSLKARTLLWLNKTSCFATFAYGYFQASVVLFLPLYLVESKGVAKEQTILIPAFFAGGMLLFSNAAGRVGDRVGHLLVMRVLSAIGLVMILGFVFLDSFALMCAAVFVAGATLASISPVSLALQGVVTPPADYGRSNAIYNAFYAAGILLGPPLSSALFARWGGAAMLFHLAALWGAFVAFSAVFFADDPAARGARGPVLIAGTAPEGEREGEMEA